MKKQQFRITIDAPTEKVWAVLWNDETYRQWTSPFSEGSRAETDWKKGSKILFLDGEGQGMVSKVKETIPHEFMSIEHLGIIKDGKEILDDDKVKEWAGALENYTLTNIGGKTDLVVDMDITEEYADFMQQTWPKALDKVKEISEKNKVSA